MDISQTILNINSLSDGRSHAYYNEPQPGADFKSVLAQCGGGCATPKQAGFSGSILNVGLAVFGLDNQGDDDPVKGFIDALFDHITGTREPSPATDAAEQESGPYGFTPAFQSVFGGSGPLIDFINATTARLGLTAEKNLALQNISINNKDATRSRESIDKIAAELKAAGIAA